MHEESFEIVIKGTLSAPLTNGIEANRGFAVTQTENGRTHFVGRTPDQARLHGMLDELQRLGIEIISINAVSSTSDPTGSDENSKGAPPL
jgi:hypothetical protein